ncbi:MAG: hypothetical protein ACREPS_10470, partial [Rhodanobacteraceae bacterium]
LVLATHGRGLWIFDNLEALEQWQPRMADDAFHLFPASQGTEWLTFDGRHIGPAPGDYTVPNPPDGPQIAYSLAKAIAVPKGCAAEEKKEENGQNPAKGSGKAKPPGETVQKGAKQKGGEKKHAPPFDACNPVTISITDSAGQPVATVRGPGKAGINRVAWNMRYTGVELPKSMRAQYSEHTSHEPKGPLALPGSYQIVVKADHHNEKGTLQVVADPRVATPMDVQRAAFESAMKLRGEAAATVAMIGRTHAMLATLDKILASTSGAAAGSTKAAVHASAEALKQQLGDFARNLYNPDVQYKVPEDDLHYIAPYGMTLLGLYQNTSYMGPNQAPNARQQQYIAKMAAKLQPYLDNFNGPLHQAIDQYNQKAKQAGVQTLSAGSPVKIGDPHLLAPAT